MRCPQHQLDNIILSGQTYKCGVIEFSLLNIQSPLKRCKHREQCSQPAYSSCVRWWTSVTHLRVWTTAEVQREFRSDAQLSAVTAHVDVDGPVLC